MGRKAQQQNAFILTPVIVALKQKDSKYRSSMKLIGVFHCACVFEAVFYVFRRC